MSTKNDAAKVKAEALVKMGVSEALLDAIPELNKVKKALDKGNEAKALEIFKQTDFYKNVDVKERVIQKIEQPGVYTKAVKQRVLENKKRLIGRGIHLDDDTLEDYTEKAYSLGLTDIQFDQMIIKGGNLGGTGGELESQSYGLQAYANSFGVARMFNSSYWDQKKKDLFAGTITTDDIQADIRNTAASAYPAYAEQIQRGVSVDSLASAYKSSIASILEVDPDSVTYDNKYLKRAMQNVGPDGKPSVKPLWQFEKELRSTNEWQYTNNARDSIDSMGLKVLRDWGLA